MGMLWSASFRHLLRHPVQLLLALLGLALGVATIVAVDVATGSAARAFELSLSAVQGAATHELDGGPAGLDEALYVHLARTLHFVRVNPIVDGYVTVAGRSLQLLGVDPLVATGFAAQDRGPDSGSVTFDSAHALAQWLSGNGAVVLTQTRATQLGLAPGATFSVDAGGHALSGHLLGVVDGPAPGLESVMLTDLSTAQEWLGLVGRLTRIDLEVPPGAAAAAELAQLSHDLPAGVTVAVAAQRARIGLDMTQAFTTNLRALSLLALLVGLFLVYGTMSFAIVQRRRSLGILRALGATRAQLLRIIAMETVGLALIGGAAGLAAGALIGRELVGMVSRTINDLYYVVAVNSVALPAREPLLALGAALAVALLAAAVPALEAIQSAPQLALRNSVIEGRARRVTVGLLALSVLLALACVVFVMTTQRSVLAGFAALVLAMLSVAAATPAVLYGSARLLARSPVCAAPPLRLALGGVAGSLSRTGVAIAALAMAVAAMIGISIMVDSFRESLRDWLAHTLPADIYVGAPGPGFARPERRIDAGLVSDLVRVSGVAGYSASRRAVVDSDRGPLVLDAMDITPGMRAGVDLTAAAADVWRGFADGAVLLAQPLAYRLHLDVGASLPLRTAQGPRSFRVVGVFREYGNDRGSVRISRAVYRRLWQDDSVSTLALYVTPGTAVTAVVQRLYAVAAGRQALQVDTPAQVRVISLNIFDRTFIITRVLNWLAAGVAAIGLLSALLAWQLGRTHELALLRVLGLTRSGAALMILAQTLFMGGVALLAALPAGLLTAVLLVRVINRRAFGWQIDLHLHPAQITSAVVLALLAALLAGVYPAWRTAHAPLSQDLREE
ncbi:MAG TPA: FtsX-like permease family protein [Steroidobacteraceae bacterium]|jgi:putative ABC transport system permease protein|nr:FtsX-like permease family protein [Steroidobacteraceae bacterium]